MERTPERFAQTSFSFLLSLQSVNIAYAAIVSPKGNVFIVTSKRLLIHARGKTKQIVFFA